MSTAETCAICGMQDGLHRVTCVVVSCMSKSTPPPIVEWQTLYWSEKTARVKAEQERDGWTKMAADQASEIAKLQAELAEVKRSETMEEIVSRLAARKKAPPGHPKEIADFFDDLRRRLA